MAIAGAAVGQKGRGSERTAVYLPLFTPLDAFNGSVSLEC